MGQEVFLGVFQKLDKFFGSNLEALVTKMECLRRNHTLPWRSIRLRDVTDCGRVPKRDRLSIQWRKWPTRKSLTPESFENSESTR